VITKDGARSRAYELIKMTSYTLAGRPQLVPANQNGEFGFSMCGETYKDGPDPRCKAVAAVP
jgi:hypothetical protein